MASVDFQALRDSHEVAPAVSKVMRANRKTGSVPESLLCQAIYRLGLRGYRRNLKTLPGSPDIAFTRKKIGVFVHGCYWHGCPNCNAQRVPSKNTRYWAAKFEYNRTRDDRNFEAMQRMGFRVLVLWECEVKRDPNASALRVLHELNLRNGESG